MTDRYAPDRAALMQRLRPDGFPTLWCPLLTPYRDDGRIDAERLRAHLAFLTPHVGGFLVPGSTGDGWQLDAATIRELLTLVLDESDRRGFALLIGVLKTDAAEALVELRATAAWLRERSGAIDDLAAMRRYGVCGYTVCPPKGAGLGQPAIAAALDALAATGLPLSVYQLPQVTDNEMSSATVAALAARHPNVLLLKDTSGADRVAASGLRDLFLVRGAEGGYDRHLALAGGDYDGYLLSTANVFGPQYASLIAALRAGRRDEATALAARIDAVVSPTFAAAAQLPYGNAFTNANKALDHHMAHGPAAAQAPPPRVQTGQRLPAELVALAGRLLHEQGLAPARGYLSVA